MKVIKYFFEQIIVLFKPVILKAMRYPAIIFRIDGGTCSQLNNYLSIKILQEEYHCRILADVSWYISNDNNENSIYARPFNVDKLFVLDNFEKASSFEIWLYRLLFPYFPTDEDKRENGISVNLALFALPKAPCYLMNYYYFGMDIIQKNIWKYCALREPLSILGSDNIQLYNNIIKERHTIGLHVRRGDMANEGGYWEVIPAEYFINICNAPELQKFTFYFFSEEPKWIEKNILPYISVKYIVSKNNSSYNGYKDLFLLSCCKYQAVSQGSFGIYAYLINKHKDKKLIVYDKMKAGLWNWSEI